MANVIFRPRERKVHPHATTSLSCIRTAEEPLGLKKRRYPSDVSSRADTHAPTYSSLSSGGGGDGTRAKHNTLFHKSSGASGSHISPIASLVQPSVRFSESHLTASVCPNAAAQSMAFVVHSFPWQKNSARLPFRFTAEQRYHKRLFFLCMTGFLESSAKQARRCRLPRLLHIVSIWKIYLYGRRSVHHGHLCCKHFRGARPTPKSALIFRKGKVA